MAPLQQPESKQSLKKTIVQFFADQEEGWLPASLWPPSAGTSWQADHLSLSPPPTTPCRSPPPPSLPAPTPSPQQLHPSRPLPRPCRRPTRPEERKRQKSWPPYLLCHPMAMLFSGRMKLPSGEQLLSQIHKLSSQFSISGLMNCLGSWLPRGKALP